jgi:hypothetical protein
LLRILIFALIFCHIELKDIYVIVVIEFFVMPFSPFNELQIN